MHKFQIAGIAKNDVTKKIFLSLPKAKHHESFEIQEPDPVKDIQRFVTIAVKKKDAMKNYHYTGGSCVGQILSRHPFPLSLDSLVDDANSPISVYEKTFLGKTCNDKKKTESEVIKYRTEFMHREQQECGVWIPSDDINENREDNSFAKKMFIVHELEHQIHGPASTIDNMDIVYTCQYLKCVVHCPCSICCDRLPTCKRLCGTEVCEDCNQQCKQHEVRPPRAFDPATDCFTLVTDKLDKYRFAHPYAGIPSSCLSCSKDVLEHQLFHMVFHLRCRLCKYEARPFFYKDVQNIDDFKKAARKVQLSDEKTCKICLVKYVDKSSRKKHEMSVHENKGKYECEICNKSYSNTTSLIFHKATHSTTREKSVCSECGKQFSSKECLLRHIKCVHGDGSQTPNINCEKCEKSFTLAATLKRHMKEKHNRKYKNLDFVENLDKIDEFECVYCDSKFKRKSHMDRHISTVHIQNDKEFMCSQCDSSFGRKDSLARHVKSHH